MYELKNDLAAIIAEAETGTDVLVTRHNKPVARLTRSSVRITCTAAPASATPI